MSRQGAELHTANLELRPFRTGLISTDKPTINFSSGVVTPANGGSWDRRATLGIKSITKILGHRVNTVVIVPWVESCNSNTNVKFRIDGYRGPNCYLERIAVISGITGSYAISAQPVFLEDDPARKVPVATSGRFCDRLSVVTDYTNATGFSTGKVFVKDATAISGMGQIYFQTQGIDYIAINPTSTVAGKLSFGISGF